MRIVETPTVWSFFYQGSDMYVKTNTEGWNKNALFNFRENAEYLFFTQCNEISFRTAALICSSLAQYVHILAIICKISCNQKRSLCFRCCWLFFTFSEINLGKSQLWLFFCEKLRQYFCAYFRHNFLYIFSSNVLGNTKLFLNKRKHTQPLLKLLLLLI